MNLKLKPVFGVIISVAGFGLYFLSPAWSAGITFAGLFITFILASRINILSSRILFYITILLHASVVYLGSDSIWLTLMPLVTTPYYLPSNLTARTFKGYKFMPLSMLSFPLTLICFWMAWPSGNWIWAGVLSLALNIVYNFFNVTGFFSFNSQKKERWGIQTGEQVPDFTLPKLNQSGEFQLSKQRGRYILLSFIRGEWCPVCQVHLRVFQKEAPRLLEHNVKMVVIQTDPSPEARRYAETVGLDYDILSDENLEVTKIFDAVDRKSKYKGKNIPLPVSFLIGPEGTLEFSNKPDDILTFLDPETVRHRLTSSLPLKAA